MVKRVVLSRLEFQPATAKRWRDIEVLRQPSGKPYLKLHGEARRIHASLDASTAHVTITHSRDHALDVVIFE